MADDYAICTFRDDGPIKTWSAMRGANVHNARTKPIEHAIEGAPAPEHLIGMGDLVADVKRHLRAAGIDPANMRKNGVIAFEAIMTASPGFFEIGDPAAREARLRAWTDAQVDFARKRWGDDRVVSMVLHLDEKTPHIHLVVLPLELKTDARRKGQAARHALVGRMISGPGQFDQLQDDYAAAMAPFGLVRGIKGSGRKHEPVPVYLARLAAKEREVHELRVALIRERDALATERAAVARERAEMARGQRLVLKASAEIRRKSLAAWKETTEAERVALDTARAQAALLADRSAADAVHDARARELDAGEVQLDAATACLTPTFEKARDFLRALAALHPEDMKPSVREAAWAVGELQAVAPAMRVPARIAPQPISRQAWPAASQSRAGAPR